MEIELGHMKAKTIAWNGDWNVYKRMFKAASRLNGTFDAVRAGELVAQGLTWPPTKSPAFAEIPEALHAAPATSPSCPTEGTDTFVKAGVREEADLSDDFIRRVLAQSPILAAMLTLLTRFSYF